MAIDRKVALAGLAAGVGAIEDRQVHVLKPRRTLQGHGSADEDVGGVDLTVGKADLAQQVEAGIVQLGGRNAEDIGAEFGAQRPLVENEADIEGRGQGILDLGDLVRPETSLDQPFEIDPRSA